MNPMDNTKVIEALEKVTVFTYCEKLLEAAMQKLVLFSVFPYTAAANMSDPHYHGPDRGYRPPDGAQQRQH